MMASTRYAELYIDLLRNGKSEFHFGDVSFDDLGRAIEVKQLRVALIKWAKEKGVKTASRFDKESGTLRVYILR